MCPFCFYRWGITSSSHRPPKGDFIDILSSDCHHINLIPLLLSYSSNNLVHIFLNMFSLTHSWNRRWHVEPEPYSFGSIFHWHPSVLRAYKIPSNTFLNGIAGRPTLLFGFSFGNMMLILFHNSSEILVMAALFLFLLWLQ